jgi:hypothetical protein
MTRRTTRSRLVALALLAVLGSGAAHAGAVVLDDFETLEGWSSFASEGSRVWIVPEPGRTGMGMRIDFDLNTGGGWVIVRKAFSVALPDNYAFTFNLRGEARPNTFEFKLVDASGKNVWWRTRRDFTFPPEWQAVAIRKARLEFAWGPARGRPLKQVGAIELAISAGEGGGGSVWIDDLAFEQREVATHEGLTPDVRASSYVPGNEPLLVVDDNPDTGWRSEAFPEEQWVIVDLIRNCEHGGLVIDWDPVDYATTYEVEASADRVQWATAYTTTRGHGGRAYIYMPDAESRFVRLRMQKSHRGQGYAIRALSVKPVEFSASPNQFFEAIARDAPFGMYPKYLYGRQSAWTVVGVDGDDKEALLNEEGMLEVDKGAFSIEPFVHVGGELLTWHAVTTTQELEDGYLPIPSVTWRHERLRLEVTAFAGGAPGSSMLYATYRVENQGKRAEAVHLFLALRPFQVNPPWQSINMTGGTTPVQELSFDGRIVWVNRDKAVVSLTPPAAFGAATFDEGALTDFLLADGVPPQTAVTDPRGFASGALLYRFELEPGAHAEVVLAVPFHEPQVAPMMGLGAEDARELVAAEHEVARRHWRTALARVEIDPPPDGERVVAVLKTTLAYILINRDGPALRPGSRNYARSWIRDGAATSVALLEMGFPEEVRDFLRWYARYQAPDGKVPCCVDRRGADPTPEHDSTGEFIYALMAYYRYTHDIGLVNDMWPRVVRAVDYLVALRARRLTDAFKAPEKRAFYGLLPESISHEGYASHPVHSYWDDFFALRGLKDAAAMAVVVGDDERAERFAALRDSFRETLYASIALAMADHRIEYVPGSVELGDFDPTSTAIALDPGEELEHLPRAALEHTYERYYAEFQERWRGGGEWEAYSPYEIRNVLALLRLGQKERALDVLDHLLADQRPPAWNAWAEIAWRDPTAPRFIGDMPHTWVGADFVRAVRSLFVYEHEAERSLVLAAGVRPEWATSEHGVTVRRLPTHWGVLSYTLRGAGDAVRLRLSGDLSVPPGGIVVRSPLARRLRAVRVNGHAIETFGPESARIGEFPADVVLLY